ncbi:MAG: ribosome silencing factor [Firmicutes bacterium HGW-Firmicutes-9]|nr:MAG: ribosome silencing factor [Firmicutes bacterium HGW-Firmicutes-9]
MEQTYTTKFLNRKYGGIHLNESIKQKALAVCEVLYNKKAQDIVAIHVADKTIVADWFIICSGRATQQVKSLADEVDHKASELGLTLRRSQGYGDAKWIVLDFADILVHIFYPEERKYYNMERLWDEDDSAIRYSELKDEEAREAARLKKEKAEK